MLTNHREELARQTDGRSSVSVGRRLVVAMNPWVCLCIVVWALGGCGSARVEGSATGQTTWGVANPAWLSASGASSAATSTSAPVVEVAPVQPKVLGLRSQWSHACTVADKQKPCKIEALDVADDGTIVAGGGTYVAARFGGISHSLRGMESLVLAAFDPNGKPLWARSLGKEAHNKIFDIQCSGDVIYIAGGHGNGFDLGKHRMRDFPRPPSTPGNDLSFMAEATFVAAYRRDGTLLWAKDLHSFFGVPEQPTTTSPFRRMARMLFPDRQGGVYVAVTGQDPVNKDTRTLHTVHIVDGKPEPPRTYEPKPTLFGVVGEGIDLDLDGNVFTLVNSTVGTSVKHNKGDLLRLDHDGNVRSTPLWDQEIGTGEIHSLFVTAYLRTVADGSVVIASKEVPEVLSAQDGLMRRMAHLRVIRVDSKGHVVVNRKVTTPVVETSYQSRFFDLKTVAVNSAGELVIVLDHQQPLVIDGAMITPTRLSSEPNKHGGLLGGVTVLRGTFEPGRATSIGLLAPPPCVVGFPGYIQGARAWRDRLLLMGSALSEGVPSAGCREFANASYSIASVLELN